MKKDKSSRADGIINTNMSSNSLVFIASYLRNIVQGHYSINLYSEMLLFEDYKYVLILLLITMINKMQNLYSWNHVHDYIHYYCNHRQN